MSLFGVACIVATVWVFVDVLNASESNLARIRLMSRAAAVFMWLAFVIAGYWYVFSYKADKAIILKGPWPFAHNFFMETKEHLVIMLLLLATYLPIAAAGNLRGQQGSPPRGAVGRGHDCPAGIDGGGRRRHHCDGRQKWDCWRDKNQKNLNMENTGLSKYTDFLRTFPGLGQRRQWPAGGRQGKNPRRPGRDAKTDRQPLGHACRHRPRRICPFRLAVRARPTAGRGSR